MLLLETLLLEIGNLDDNELVYARHLAYIFHNIPALLRQNLTQEVAEQAWSAIYSRSEALGVGDLINQ